MRKPIDQLLARYKEPTREPALEILEHIYKTLVAFPEFRLKDGSMVRFEPFVAPGSDADGEIQCGFDVRLEDGSHLEFMVRNTGWGKSLVTPAGRGRSR